jgi:hypothetical protein
MLTYLNASRCGNARTLEVHQLVRRLLNALYKKHTRTGVVGDESEGGVVRSGRTCRHNVADDLGIYSS